MRLRQADKILKPYIEDCSLKPANRYRHNRAYAHYIRHYGRLQHNTARYGFDIKPGFRFFTIPRSLWKKTKLKYKLSGNAKDKTKSD